MPLYNAERKNGIFMNSIFHLDLYLTNLTQILRCHPVTSHKNDTRTTAADY